jgi:peptide/nickel transport system permease protein
MVWNVLKEIFSWQSKMTLFMIFGGLFIILVVLLSSLFSPFLAPYSPVSLDFKPLEPPNLENLFGTDLLGRDVFSRVIYGGRVSILIATLSICMSLCISVPLAGLFTYIGGRLDTLMMLLMDSLWVFPIYLLALVMTLLFGTSVVTMSMTIGIAFIPSVYRMVRSLSLTIKEQTFIEAERSLGASTGYIVYKHILPYTLPTLIVITSLNLAQAIIIVSSLNFLGFGIPPPTPDWGTDLCIGNRVWLGGSWWCTFFPGLMIFLTVAGFNLFGEGLDALLEKRKKF